MQFRPSRVGRWDLHRSEFIELSARPMLDLSVPSHLLDGGVADYVRAEHATADSESIVRLSCPTNGNKSKLAAFSAQRLRQVLPPTMNYQLSVDLRDG